VSFVHIQEFMTCSPSPLSARIEMSKFFSRDGHAFLFSVLEFFCFFFFSVTVCFGPSLHPHPLISLTLSAAVAGILFG